MNVTYEDIAKAIASVGLVPPVTGGWDRGYETARTEIAKQLAALFDTTDEFFAKNAEGEFFVACDLTSRKD